MLIFKDHNFISGVYYNRFTCLSIFTYCTWVLTLCLKHSSDCLGCSDCSGWSTSSTGKRSTPGQILSSFYWSMFGCWLLVMTAFGVSLHPYPNDTDYVLESSHQLKLYNIHEVHLPPSPPPLHLQRVLDWVEPDSPIEELPIRILWTLSQHPIRWVTTRNREWKINGGFLLDFIACCLQWQVCCRD